MIFLILFIKKKDLVIIVKELKMVGIFEKEMQQYKDVSYNGNRYDFFYLCIDKDDIGNEISLYRGIPVEKSLGLEIVFFSEELVKEIISKPKLEEILEEVS